MKEIMRKGKPTGWFCHKNFLACKYQKDNRTVLQGNGYINLFGANRFCMVGIIPIQKGKWLSRFKPGARQLFTIIFVDDEKRLSGGFLFMGSKEDKNDFDFDERDLCEIAETFAEKSVKDEKVKGFVVPFPEVLSKAVNFIQHEKAFLIQVGLNALQAGFILEQSELPPDYPMTNYTPELMMAIDIIKENTCFLRNEQQKQKERRVKGQKRLSVLRKETRPPYHEFFDLIEKRLAKGASMMTICTTLCSRDEKLADVKPDTLRVAYQRYKKRINKT